MFKTTKETKADIKETISISNQNRGNNFNQNHQNNQGQVFQPPTNQPPVYQVPPYQAPTPQIQGVSKTDFENYVKANDAVLKNVQNQGQNLQNQMANVTSLLTSLCNNFKNSASTSNSGTLPSQTVTNPRQQINAITTRSGKTLEGPSTPLVPTPVVSIPSKEPEQNPETSTEKVQNPNLENTAQVPPPEEEESIFMEIPKPKAKKTVNVEIQDLNSPKPTSYQSKLPYPERMKVRENDKPSAQHSRFLKQTLRLEIGLKDALVEMPKFNKWLSSLLRNKEKLEESAITICECLNIFVVVNFEPDPKSTIILGERPFLRTAKALIDLYEETLTLRVGKEELVYYADKSEKNKNKHCAHAISVIDFSKDDPFSGSTTTHSDDPSPSSSPVKTKNFQVYSNPLFEFDDNFKSSSINPLFDKMEENVEIKNSNEPVLLNTPLSDKDECFAPEDNNDEIDDFLAMEVSSNLEQGYFDSIGDVIFLDNLLSDDDSHNLASEVISDHEPEQNESSITFSPGRDTLNMMFACETFKLPARFMGGISLPYLLSPSEDSEPTQEEIDIFLVPDDLFAGLLRQCPHHGFSELHQLDTFYNSLNTNDQDALDSAAGGNFLDKMPRDGLAIIESKSKVRYSRSRAIEPRVSTNAPLSTSTPSNSFEFQQLAASLEDKMDIRMSRLEKMISEKNVTTPATVKAVEEVCVTCGSNHNFNNCPLTRSGNDFPVFHDNIHQFQQTAAVGNFVQRNPPNLANQMRPPGFNQPNVQNQGQNLQNQMANVTSLLTSLCNNFKNSASTSNSGTLPSQTVTNPRQQINAITTRSGKTLEGPSTPLVPTPVVSNPQKEPEQNPETSTEKVQNPNLENTAHVPPPEEEESIFMEIPKLKANFKQLRLKIGLKDALIEMPKFNKWLSSLLRNK
ncbi:hypothetical protein Tco_0211236 [Tanacetum coccineum]